MSNVLVYDLGGTKCDFGVFDEDGQLIVKERFFTKSLEGKDAIIQKLLDVAGEYASKFEIEKCVIGVPGVVASDQSTLINAPNIDGFQNINLGEIFREKYPQMKVVVENDVNLFTLGGFKESNSQSEIFVGITLGTGIGGGVIVNKRLIKGADSLAGEFGHMVIDYKGEQCHCGQKGCWERYASASAFIERIKTHLQENPETETILPKDKVIMNDVAEALSKGDKFCLQMLDEITSFIAIGIANLINVIDPGVIVLGGSLGELLEYFYKNLVAEVQKRLIGKEIKCQIINIKNPDIQLIGGFLCAE